MLEWLTAAHPDVELAHRRASGWLAQHLPEVDALYGVPQTAAHHPEVCTGAHIELCLAAAAKLSDLFDVRFAVLGHDFGKGLTPSAEWPQHINHERAGLAPLKRVLARFNLPDSTAKLALLVCEYHLHAHRMMEMNDASVVKFLVKTGMADDAELAENFILACEADARGRLGHHDRNYPQANFLRAARDAVMAHPYPPGVTMQDPEGNRIHASRVHAVKQVRATFAVVTDKPAC